MAGAIGGERSFHGTIAFTEQEVSRYSAGEVLPREKFIIGAFPENVGVEGESLGFEGLEPAVEIEAIAPALEDTACLPNTFDDRCQPPVTAGQETD